MIKASPRLTTKIKDAAKWSSRYEVDQHLLKLGYTPEQLDAAWDTINNPPPPVYPRWYFLSRGLRNVGMVIFGILHLIKSQAENSWPFVQFQVWNEVLLIFLSIFIVVMVAINLVTCLEKQRTDWLLYASLVPFLFQLWNTSFLLFLIIFTMLILAICLLVNYRKRQPNWALYGLLICFLTFTLINIPNTFLQSVYPTTIKHIASHSKNDKTYELVYFSPCDNKFCGPSLRLYECMEASILCDEFKHRPSYYNRDYNWGGIDWLYNVNDITELTLSSKPDVDWILLSRQGVPYVYFFVNDTTK